MLPRHLHVDHQVHVLRVNPPRRQVGGAEDPGVELPECLHDGHPPGLVLDGGHEHGGKSPTVEVVRGGLGDAGVVAEHEALGVGEAGQEGQEGRLLDGVLLVLDRTLTHGQHQL